MFSSTRKCIKTLLFVSNHFGFFFLNSSVLQCIHVDVIIKYTVHNLSEAEFTDVTEVRRASIKLQDTWLVAVLAIPKAEKWKEARKQCQGSAVR